MAVVKINAIEVDPERGLELEKRFSQRAAQVENAPGFLGFDLLRPTAGEDRYFVVTRWESDEAFETWKSSAAFAAGHAQAAADRGSEKPVGRGSSVLEFEVVLSVEPATLEA